MNILSFFMRLVCSCEKKNVPLRRFLSAHVHTRIYARARGERK